MLQNVTIADINKESGEKAEEELNKKYGGKHVIFVLTDVTKDSSFESKYLLFNLLLIFLDCLLFLDAFQESVDNFKQLDIIINNAGVVEEFKYWFTVELNLVSYKNSLFITYL